MPLFGTRFGRSSGAVSDGGWVTAKAASTTFQALPARCDRHRSAGDWRCRFGGPPSLPEHPAELEPPTPNGWRDAGMTWHSPVATAHASTGSPPASVMKQVGTSKLLRVILTIGKLLLA